MKSLSTLIQLQKTRIDAHRLVLGQLQDRLDRIDGQIAELELSKIREQEAATGEARGTFGAFVQTLIRRGHALQKEKTAAAAAVRQAQDELADLFAEQKRFEIAEQNRLVALAADEKRRETHVLDEIGSMAHERRKS